MKPSESVFIPIRGLKYHCRIWGDAGAPQLVLLHGFQDVSASWQFTVDALQGKWHVIAPDWRGYGLTDWSGADSYWFRTISAISMRCSIISRPSCPCFWWGTAWAAMSAACTAACVPSVCASS